jgi:hypothetical protein
VHDNIAALGYLDNPRLHVVRFEELANATTVVQTLEQIAQFLKLPITTPRLLMALLPPSTPLVGNEHCSTFDTEEAKVADLKNAYLSIIDHPFNSSEFSQTPDPRKSHESYRAWQVSQASRCDCGGCRGAGWQHMTLHVVNIALTSLHGSLPS